MSTYKQATARLSHFLQEMYGDPPEMTRVEVEVDAQSGGAYGTPHLEATEVRVYAGDEQLLPDFEALPYWQEILAAYPHLFRECTTHQDHLATMQELLEHERLYLEYGLDWPDSSKQVVSPLCFTKEELHRVANGVLGEVDVMDERNAEAELDSHVDGTHSKRLKHLTLAGISHPHPGRFYVLDEQSAQAFDAKQPPENKRFVTMLPESNAYLLDEGEFDPFEYPDLDPGDLETGCSLDLDPDMSLEQRRYLCSRLVAFGYDVSLSLTRLLLVPGRRDVVTETVERDVLQVLSEMSLSITQALELLSLAQEVFAPLSAPMQEIGAWPSALSLLHSAARKFQAARRFLEEGSDILEDFNRVDLHLLVPGVTASCHSDDYAVSVERFDATLWLAREASDEDLRRLRDEGCGGNYTADRVAEFAASYDSSVAAMFDHNDALPPGVELRGFECYVNEEELLAWIAQHRPHLLTKEEAGE